MTGIASGWNIVVAGSWNPAILTPAGIAKRLFQLESGTPVAVEVSLESPGPFRVKHDGVTVVPTRGRLVVEPSDCTDEKLAYAAKIVSRAISGLPETPFTAAGVNVRYNFESVPSRLISLIEAPLDQVVSDAGREIREREVKRSLKYGKGLLNLELKITSDQAGEITLNFHMRSSDPQELEEWVGKACDHAATARQIIRNELQLEIEGQENDQDN